MKNAFSLRTLRPLVQAAVLVSLGSVCASCESGDAGGAWSSLSACLIGEPALADNKEILNRLHAVELAEKVPASVGGDDAWPKRCAQHANALYKAIGDSGSTAVLKRTLAKTLGCTDEGKCEFSTEVPTVPGAFDIWQGAQIAGLEYKAPSGVTLPKTARATLSTDVFKPLVSDKLTLADAMRSTSGDVTFLFRAAPEKKAPFTACNVTGSIAKCSEVHGDAAPMSAHSVRLLREHGATYVSGIAEAKEVEPGKPPQITRRAFDFATGAEVKFAGPAEGERVDGLVIERGENDEGLVAMLLRGGRAVKKVKLDVAGKPDHPVVVGNAFAYVTEGSEPKLVVGNMTNTGVKGAAEHTGVEGTAVACVATDGGAFGVWGRAAHQKDAKPTDGKDGTKVTFVFSKDGELSKPVSGTIPFDRRETSPLSCTNDGASLGWVKYDDGHIVVGSLECTADACTTKTSKFPALEVKRWVLFAHAGKDLALMWTTALDDTRLRVGSAEGLADAKETILFDSAERGGPKLRRLDGYDGNGVALLLVQDDGPQLLSVSSSGDVSAVIGK